MLSYVRLGESPASLNQVRIDIGEAEAVIACDLVVATDARALAVMQAARTRAVANADIIPTADFIKNRSIDFAAHQRIKTLKDACGKIMSMRSTPSTLRCAFWATLFFQICSCSASPGSGPLSPFPKPP